MNKVSVVKLGLLSALYFSQGLPFGFFTQALPVFLRQQNLSLMTIGLTSLLSIPWALKFLWAPYVDKYGAGRADHRHRWILPLQYAAALTMFGVAWLDPSAQLPLILAAVLLANLLAATQDIATDGLAVDTLEPHERGLGNGIQVAGYRVGMIVGGGVLLITYATLGWRGTFLTLSALLMLATAPILFTRPRVGNTIKVHFGPSKVSKARPWDELKLIPEFFRQPGMWAWASVLAAYKLGDAMASGMLRPWLVDIGQETAQIGLMLGAAGFSAGLLGALVGGAAVGRLGRRRALLSFGLLQAVGIAGYAVAAWLGSPDSATLYTVTMLEHFTGGMATAALFTCMMDRCRPEASATDYTIMASIVVMTTGVGQAISGLLATWMGYTGLYGLSVGVALVGVALCALWVPADETPKRLSY